MSIEVLKQALEALEHAAECVKNNSCPAEMGHDWDEQIESLRQAITTEESSAVQEPVAWGVHDQIALNKTPETNPQQKREWVGLTDEEIKHIEETTTCLANESWLRNLTRNIEAKLKEKNT